MKQPFDAAKPTIAPTAIPPAQARKKVISDLMTTPVIDWKPSAPITKPNENAKDDCGCPVIEETFTLDDDRKPRRRAQLPEQREHRNGVSRRNDRAKDKRRGPA